MKLDGKGIILAVDHAPLGLLKGLDRIDELVAGAAKSSLAGVIVNYGVLKRYGQTGMDRLVGPVARVDGNRTFLGGDWRSSSEWELLYEVEACKRLGAQAVIVNLLLGSPAEMASIKVVAKAAMACSRAEIPLLVSAMSFNNEQTEPQHAFAAHMAYELGADAVSVYGVHDGHCMEEVARWCPIPFYAQGAPPSEDSDDLRRWVASCVASGARGLVMGRAIWQSPDPAGVIRQLTKALAS